jgi:hypothetical protein
MNRLARVGCAAVTGSGVAIIAFTTGAGCFSSSTQEPDAGTDATALDAPVADTTPDTTTTPVDAGVDALESAAPEPAPEAGPEAGPDVVEAAADAGPDAADAAPEAGCAPRSVSGFVAPPYVPANFSGNCFGFADAAPTLAADCFGDAASYSACAADTDATLPDGSTYASCLGCLVTPENDDAGYGATILATIPIVNLAGCVQANDSTDAGFACAAAIQAAWQCADYACSPSCPVHDAPSRAAYLACARAAAAGPCVAYATAANTCLAAEVDEGDSGVQTLVSLDCLSDAGQRDPTANLLLYFCGS